MKYRICLAYAQHCFSFLQSNVLSLPKYFNFHHNLNYYCWNTDNIQPLETRKCQKKQTNLFSSLLVFLFSDSHVLYSLLTL